MKIEINLKIILTLIIFFIIKNVNTYIIFIIFIIIHELSHLLVGMLIGGKPKKLVIRPFGASLEFYTYGKKKPLYRIMFFLAGPLVNFIIAIIFYYFSNYTYSNEIIIFTNLAICFFNLIPIVPLDGGKILNEILKALHIKNANKYSIIISKIVLIIISFIYSILIVKIKNIMILFLLMYLWYLFNLEQKKLLLYQKASDCIKK